MKNVLLITSKILRNLHAGDSIYIFNIAQQIARSARLSIFAFGDDEGEGEGATPLSECSDDIRAFSPPSLPRILWRSAFSRLPVMQAKNFSPVMLDAAVAFLRLHPDALVVVDHLRMAWIIEALRKETDRIYLINQNCETDVARQACEAEERVLQRLLLADQQHRIRSAEKKALGAATAFAAITDEDEQQLRRLSGRSAAAIITPGYAGAHLSGVYQPESRPRNILFSGTFFWHLKRKNLLAFLDLAAPTFEKHGIGIEIIGSGPPSIAEKIIEMPLVTLHTGEVDVPGICGNCRLALSLDSIGGGFKLKNLEYVFQGLPIVALDGCQNGLPLAEGEEIFVCDSVAQAIATIVDIIGDTDKLRTASQAALSACANQFDWAAREAPIRKLLETKAIVS